MKKDYFSAAQTLHEGLAIGSDCFLPDGKIRPVEYLVAIDDDATSALWAAYFYYLIRSQWGYCPCVVCAGGKGLMSRFSHDKSEAELLAYVCGLLGIPNSHITICGKGMNSGQNIKAVAEVVKSSSTIFVVTKRLGLRLKLTQLQQAPEMEAYYYQIEEGLQAACKIYNGKSLGNNAMMYHELASILPRCEEYGGSFQKKLTDIDFKISEEIVNASNLLGEKFRLKLHRTIWQEVKSWPQFLALLTYLILSKKRMVRELQLAIKNMGYDLIDEDLVIPGELRC